MPRLEDHPTVRAVARLPLPVRPGPLDAGELRRLCLDAGADDAGFVALDRPELDAEREGVLRLFPATRLVACVACRMSPDAIRAEARSVANHEFHETGDAVNDACRNIVKALAGRGVRAVTPAMAFPMEVENYPDRVWTLSLKPLAEAAGLGRMGLHRNVIHPRFGSFILLGAVLIDADLSGVQGRAIDFNPCLTCKLCVAACPVGAISPDGQFNFASCVTHNYREFLGGFTDWAESVGRGGPGGPTDAESASVWQSLAYGPNYKAAYCLAVCPAGEDVIRPFLDDRAGHLREVVRPLQERAEPVYVLPNSDAEAHVARRFPHKRPRRVGPVLRPTSVGTFVRLMRHAFQPGRAGDLDAVYHFRFTGAEPVEATVTIRGGTIDVRDGLHGVCGLRVTADSRSWVRFLRKEVGILRLLLTLRVRLRGDPRLLVAFGRCFP